MSFLTKEELKSQISGELWNRLVPFWLKLKDGKNGGFIGYVGPDLVPDPEAEKGCLLNSRILWFFSSALPTGGHQIPDVPGGSGSCF